MPPVSTNPSPASGSRRSDAPTLELADIFNSHSAESSDDEVTRSQLSSRLHAASTLPPIGTGSARPAQALNQAFRPQTFEDCLDVWEADGPADERPARAEANERIRAAYVNDLPELDLNGLKLTSLPVGLYVLTNLHKLTLTHNRLDALPTLPPALRYLDATGNRLVCLPALPDDLDTLIVEYNRLAALPQLPASLRSLIVSGNRLTSLPRLPATLCQMAVCGNRLTFLPALPPELTRLSARYNRLTLLPTLPMRMKLLNLRNNALTALPENFEAAISIGIAELSHNPWSRSVEERIRAMPPSTLVSCIGVRKLDRDYRRVEVGLRAHYPASLINRFLHLPSFNGKLQRWIDVAEPSERDARSIAAARISVARRYGLKGLDLSGLGLTSLPKKMSELTNLRVLSLSSNRLRKLPPLPPNLINLDVEENELSSLPVLPSGLLILDAAYNALVTLPDLPPGLTFINAIRNDLTVLPPLPETLRHLYIEGNRLRELPPLPAGLIQLIANFNRLTRLPSLPPALTEMEVANNQLTQLPALPAGIYTLDLSKNRLQELPVLFTDQITAGGIAVSDNPLSAQARKQLGRLPASIIAFFDPLSVAPTTARAQGQQLHAPFLPNAAQSRLCDEDVQTMQGALQQWDGAAGSAALAVDIAKDDGALIFAHFLNRLKQTAEYEQANCQPALVARVQELLQALRTEPQLRSLIYAIAEESTATCGDRVTLALNDMEIARICHHAEHGKFSTDDLFRMGQRMARLAEVEKLAHAKAVTLQAGGVVIDEIEVRLGYHTMLADRLQLPPVAKDMLHFEISYITPADLDEAAARVEQHSRGNDAFGFLSHWKPWQQAMERRAPGLFQEMRKNIDTKRAGLDPKPPNMNEQQWIEALADLARYEVAEPARVTTRLTQDYLQPPPQAEHVQGAGTVENSPRSWASFLTSLWAPRQR